MKKCIFYLPYKLDEHGAGARMLRPRKMIQAFCDIGYDVFVIEGVSTTRRRQIREIKKRIRNGEKYDFMYTESHTEPTLLTDPNHLPTHPFMDFSFFRFVREHGIKIGLFYCDIYWKFDTYGAELPKWKKLGALINYRYDINQYKKYLNQFYVADMKVFFYLKENKLSVIAKELPPGAEDIKVKNRSYEYRNFNTQPLSIFYVGGLGNQYQIVELIKAIQQTEQTKLIVCCREAEWEKEKDKIEPYLCERVKIIHKKSEELKALYEESDICSLLFKNDIYIEMAKPFKAYEYLAHEIPVLSTKGTGIGAFVEENDIGWNIEYEAEAISNTLKEILSDPAVIERKRNNCKIVKNNNLWTTRAQQVASDLMQINGE